ncbi:multicopper oxidase domain-containing protein [Alteromonas sp. IB21]|uniref:multicopper oxidase domain-containing protein n=1 Tax=Alteromonas sp. IB21 TaxID=2779369 RepID=UPI0018E8C43F|nr:multicopper oxidase domain-containing protein [Alteromonas sp. IB21]
MATIQKRLNYFRCRRLAAIYIKPFTHVAIRSRFNGVICWLCHCHVWLYWHFSSAFFVVEEQEAAPQILTLRSL